MKLMLSALVGSFATPIATAFADDKKKYFLDPDKVRAPLIPTTPSSQTLHGNCAGTVTYWEHDNPGKPLVLYFHGFGGNYQSAIPPEYPLLDAAHLICVHRPGYAGTDLDWKINGLDYKAPQPAAHPSAPLNPDAPPPPPSPGAQATAHIAYALLKQRFGQAPWDVCVMGTSGGGPSALAFASLYPKRTRSLILQAAVTFPWWYESYVPAIARPKYRQAVTDIETRFPDLREESLARFSRLVTQSFGQTLLEVLVGYASQHHGFAGALVGDQRAALVASDVAADAVLELEAGGRFASEPAGMGNDYISLFRASDPFCQWDAIEARTLIIHDSLDPFVPVFHAQQAASRIPNATLRLDYRLGGHMIWLGPDAAQMHAERLAFLT